VNFVRAVARRLNPEKEAWQAIGNCLKEGFFTARPLRGDDKVSVPQPQKR